jgi:hypothetical protein
MADIWIQCPQCGKSRRGGGHWVGVITHGSEFESLVILKFVSGWIWSPQIEIRVSVLWRRRSNRSVRPCIPKILVCINSKTKSRGTIVAQRWRRLSNYTPGSRNWSKSRIHSFCCGNNLTVYSVYTARKVCFVSYHLYHTERESCITSTTARTFILSPKWKINDISCRYYIIWACIVYSCNFLAWA